nr:hypothetical protein [Tanacetum cinerariifolium]
MGYEHLSITPETESKSNAKNLLPIPSECEVTSEDKRECDELVYDNHSDTFSDSEINDDISIYDNNFENIEYVEASLSDPEIVSVEEENVVQQEKEEVDLEDISQVQDIVLREKLFSITRLISNIESLKDKSTPDRALNSSESDNSLLDNFSPEFETFCDHSEETRSEGDVRFLEELLIHDSILSHELFDDNFEDNPSISRLPPEPPDDNFDLEPEEENVVHREEEEVDLEDISQVQDVVLRKKLLSITRLISNIESLNDNSTSDRVLNSFESDNSLLDNFSPEFETFCGHSEETRSGNTTHANYSLPEYDSFCFEIEPDQESDSILSHESSDPNNPSISRPPPEPPDDNSDLEPEVISAVMKEIDEPDEHFIPGGEIFVSTNNEDVDYFPFMFVIRIFLPYLILLGISPLLLSAESEDTIFDPGISD